MEEREGMYCTACQGRGLDKNDKPCEHCHGTGIEPEQFYDFHYKPNPNWQD